MITLFGNKLVTKSAMRLDIAHTYVSDIDMFLMAPNGLLIDATTDDGVGGDNFTNTRLSDACSASSIIAILESGAPFTGCFAP